VGDQGDVAQIASPDEAGDVRDVGFQVRLRDAPAGVFAEAGQRQRQRRVPLRTQSLRGVFPGPRAEPGAGNEYEGSHVISLN
jgi:hypothetical protein